MMSHKMANVLALQAGLGISRRLTVKKRWRWSNWQMGIINVICAAAGVGAVILGTGMIFGKW